MVWLLSILSILSFTAVGQERNIQPFATPVFDGEDVLSIKKLDFRNTSAYDEEALFSRSGGRSFPILKEDVTVRLKAPLPIYSSPGIVNRPEGMTDPKAEMCPYRPGQPDLDGRVLWVAGNVMAVKLKQGPNFCGTAFNAKEEVRNIVFVSADDIASIDRTEDLKTEAALPECNSRDCQTARALNDLTAKLLTMNMGIKCEDAPDFKSSEAIEGYLACYSTRHQSDYDAYYKKLIDLTVQKMTISFDSTAEDPKVPLVAPVGFSAEEDDPYRGMDRTKVPLLVTPNSNVLKCIARRESGWDRNVKSGTGARGIGQQTEINIQAVNEYLQKDPSARVVWNAYFKGAKQTFTAAQWKTLTTNTSDPDSPSSCPQTEEEWAKPIQLKDAYCPVTSIAAMAIYQVMVEFAIRDANSRYRDHSFSAEEYASVAQLMAVSHNAGITAVRRAAADSSIKFWVGNLMAQERSENRKKEVADYGLYMRRCLSGDPEVGWQSIDGGRAKNCEAFKPPKDCK